MKNRIIKNWRSGLTVALVSIPLSISLAMASGVSPIIGIVTAIVAGIVGAVFGGSIFNVIGPTGALAGLTASFVLSNGGELLPLLTVLTGLIIILGYLLKIEKYLIYVPSSVIHGFTLGIAIILIFNQINYIFGLNNLPSQSNTIEAIKILTQSFKSIDYFTLLIFLIFLLFLTAIRKFIKKIPGAIILAILAIALGYLGKSGIIPFKFYTLGDKFSEITLKISFIHKFIFNKQLLVSAITIAFVGIMETMLSSKIADGMTHTKHNPRKEMLSLGLANISSGIFGGMPATAALARTSLNIKSGANSRISGILNGIFITIISFFLLTQFKYIPMSAIAAILVDTAIRMVEAKHYGRLRKHDFSSYIISLIVAAITVIEDPIIGIGFGVVISFFLFSRSITHGHFEISVNNENGLLESISGDKLKPIREDGTVLLYSIRGNLLYMNSAAHLSRFETNYFDAYKVVIFRLREVYLIDIDGIEALDEMIGILKSKGTKVMISSISEKIAEKLRRSSKEYIFMENHGLVYDKTRLALKSIGIETTVN